MAHDRYRALLVGGACGLAALLSGCGEPISETVKEAQIQQTERMKEANRHKEEMMRIELERKRLEQAQGASASATAAPSAAPATPASPGAETTSLGASGNPDRPGADPLSSANPAGARGGSDARDEGNLLGGGAASVAPSAAPSAR